VEAGQYCGTRDDLGSLEDAYEEAVAQRPGNGSDVVLDADALAACGRDAAGLDMSAESVKRQLPPAALIRRLVHGHAIIVP